MGIILRMKQYYFTVGVYEILISSVICKHFSFRIAGAVYIIAIIFPLFLLVQVVEQYYSSMLLFRIENRRSVVKKKMLSYLIIVLYVNILMTLSIFAGHCLMMSEEPIGGIFKDFFCNTIGCVQYVALTMCIYVLGGETFAKYCHIFCLLIAIMEIQFFIKWMLYLPFDVYLYFSWSVFLSSLKGCIIGLILASLLGAVSYFYIERMDILN